MISIPLLVDYLPPGYRYLYWWIISPQGYRYLYWWIINHQGIDTSTGGLLAPQGIDTSICGLLAPRVSIPLLVDYYPLGYRYLYWWIINPQGIDTSTGGLLAPQGIFTSTALYLVYYMVY